MKKTMYYDAGPIAFQRAKELRKKLTDAEVVLWDRLKQNLLGCKFRRQHPLAGYIADFYCHQHRLVIEVDGSIHNRPDRKEYDQNRDAELRSLQLTILRFTNHEVLHHTDQVIETILKYIKSPLQGARGL